MPHAVAALRYGKVDVIDLIEVPNREPGEGQVVVAVRAAALNPFDLKMADGALGRDESKLPLRLGSEAAGVVTAVGADARAADGTPLKVGDAVFGHRLPGAAADELTVPGARLLHKPESASWEEAAGLLSAGTTAVHALTAAAVGAGDVLLVHGVSGGVGAFIAQLALLRGARVIGTAAPARHDALAAVGIEPVAYGPGLADRVRAIAPITAAIDAVGSEEALTVSLELLPDPSRLVTIVNHTATLAAGGQAIGGGPGADPGTEIRAAAGFELAELLAEGRIRVPITQTFPLAEARAAYRLLAEGHAGGKIVLIP